MDPETAAFYSAGHTLPTTERKPAAHVRIFAAAGKRSHKRLLKRVRKIELPPIERFIFDERLRDFRRLAMLSSYFL